MLFRQPSLDLSSPIDWDHPLNRGRVAWWWGDPNTAGGGRLIDLVGRTPMSLAVAPAWTPTGRGDVGLAYNGSTQYATAGTVDIPTALTISAWFRLNNVAAGSQTILSANDATAANIQYHFNVNRTAGRIGYVHATAAAYTIVDSTTALSAGGWYHGAVVRTGTTGAWTFQFYVNGVAAGSGSDFKNPSAAQPLTFGRVNASGGSEFFNGQTADLSLWSRAMSATEVASLYDQGLRGNPDTRRRLRGTSFFALSGPIYGAVSGTDAAETATVAGSVRATGSVVGTDADETATVSAAALIAAGITATDQGEAATAAGRVAVAGTIVAADANEAAAVRAMTLGCPVRLSLAARGPVALSLAARPPIHVPLAGCRNEA